MHTSKTLITVKRLAEYLSVSEKAIYEMKSRDQIPYVKIGARLRFDPDEIQAFIEENKKSPMQPLN